MKELRTSIVKDGQRFVDEPIMVYPKEDKRSYIERAVERAYQPEGVRPQRRKPIVVAHERVRLRWMKPGPDGKLAPR